MLAAVGLFALYKAAMPVRTLRGQAVMEDLKKLFSRLQQPGALQPNKSSAEVMWMAAVYGVGALAFSHVEKLYPKVRSRSSCGLIVRRIVRLIVRRRGLRRWLWRMRWITL